MKIISFGWTSHALLARRKTVTRREWKDTYARSFKAGDLVKAYDKSPRSGGKPFAIIRLTQDPYQSTTGDLTGADWEYEGFAYLSAIRAIVNGMSPTIFWLAWKAAKLPVWVIDFEVVEIL